MNNSKIIRVFLGTNIIFLSLVQACATSGSSNSADTSGGRRGISSDISSDIYEGLSETGRVKEVFVLPVLVRDLSKVPSNSSNTALQGLKNISYTNSLVRALDIHTDLNVITEIKELPTYNSTLDELFNIPESGLNQKGLFQLAKEITKITGVQSVLFTLVDLSSQRTGGGLGSEKSSEFQYRAWLYGAESQSVIWSSAYRSKQGTLTDNLFSARGRFDGGLGFRPIAELLEEGFKGSASALNDVLNKKR